MTIKAICKNHPFDIYPFEVLFEDNEVVKIPIQCFLSAKCFDPLSIRGIIINYARENKKKLKSK